MFRLLSAFLVLSPLVSGLTVTYVNVVNLLGGSGSWFDATNWLAGAISVVPVGPNDAVIAQPGTYTVAVDQALSLQGTLTLGSDTLLTANPILNVSASSSFTGITLQNGGQIILTNNAQLSVTTFTITSPNVTISGTGSLYVNGSLVYSKSGGSAWINVTFVTAGITVTNGATLYVTSSGWCNGTLNLGASGSGGELVVLGAWSLGTCNATGGGGNLTFWGQGSSATQFNVQGTHVLAYLKGADQALLNVSWLTLTGDLAVSGTGRISVNGVSSVEGNVWVVATGTYNFAVNSNLTVSAALVIGSDTTTGVDPTLVVAAGVTVSVNTLTVQTGGNVNLGSNAILWVHDIEFTGTSHSVSLASGASGASLTVNAGGSFVYGKTGGTVVVSVPFNLTGTITVANGSTVQITSSGWCDSSQGGSIFLGAAGQGGNLEIQGSWSLGNCVPNSGGGSGSAGNLTLNPSTTTNYALSQGTYYVGFINAIGSSVVTVAQAVTITGNLWIGASGKVLVNQSAAVQQNLIATGNAILELNGAAVTAVNVTFGSATTYILHAASSSPALLAATEQALFSGTIRVLSAVQISNGTNVTVATYAAHNGAFSSVQVTESASASSMASSFSTSRRLLAIQYGIEYDSTNAHAYSTNNNGVSSLAPSVLLVCLIVSLLGFLN